RRVLFLVLPADELVGSGDAHGALDARARLERFETGGDVADADHADDDALLPFNGMHFVAELANPFANVVDFLPRRMRPHRDNHCCASPKKKTHSFPSGPWIFRIVRRRQPTLPDPAKPEPERKRAGVSERHCEIRVYTMATGESNVNRAI